MTRRDSSCHPVLLVIPPSSPRRGILAGAVLDEADGGPGREFYDTIFAFAFEAKAADIKEG